MSYLMQEDCVQYVCSCGSLKSIARIYFCRHCLSIRCGYCLCHEADSFYCPNCMENPPPSEVRLKKNKCSNCFECPCCFQTLTIRGGQVLIKPSQSSTEEDVNKPTPKKVYYLSCSSCRWTSRDAGIPDQNVATGSWPEQENPNALRINSLIAYHKILASKEKQQKVIKKFQPRRSFLQYEKFGITSAMARKRSGRASDTQSQNQSSDQPSPSKASDKVDELTDIFTKSLDITKITTIEQRLQNPELQAETLNELRPRRKQFVVKRSQRCRTCEHNVSKPDYCPQSIKFKIQLSAFFHIPEIRIVSCEPLRIGKTSILLLKFCNPTQHQTQIMLLPSDTPIVPTTTIRGVKEELTRENIQMGSESPNLLPAAVRQTAVVEEPKKITLVENADISTPNSVLILPPKDDAAEYDDPNDSHNFQDDANVVIWRKGNKAVVRLQVLPHVVTDIQKDKPVIVSFVMQYGYVNTIATLEHKTPQKLDLKVKLFLNLGNLVDRH